MEQLREALKHHENPEILDVATGSGMFLELLSKAVANPKRLVGIDQKEIAIDSARTKFAHEKNFRFERMDAHQLAFEDESFDIVAISNSLHHLSNLEGGLKEMVRVLKSGGSLVIYEMVSDGLTEKQQTHMLLHHYWAEIDRRCGVDHNPTYTRAEMKALFKDQVTLRLLKESEINETMDETSELMASLKDSIIAYMEKSKDWEDAAVYAELGNKLLQRIETVGFELATECLMVYRKA